ncbi:hypothetical protein FSP39_004180, partial [Pinctada imbricata]
QTGQGDKSDSEKPYYIEKNTKRTITSTLATDTSFKVKFNDQWQGEKLKDVSDQLHEMFEDVLSEARGHDADLGRVVIQHPNLMNPIVVPLQPWDTLNSDAVMDAIANVLNSNEELDVDEDMTVTTTLTSNDQGCRLDQILKYKTVPKRYYQHLLDKKRKKLRTDLALYLCRSAGVPTTRYLGLNDIPNFEQPLNVNIFVISSKVGDKFVRIANNDERPNLYLYHIETETEQHWHGIANIQEFFKGKFFCKTCQQPYNRKQHHSCETSCEVCLDQNCRITKNQMSCRSCGRLCRSQACFNRHKDKRNSKKKAYPSQCRTCKKTIKSEERSPENHCCGEWKCAMCQRYHVGEHYCYQRSEPLPTADESKIKFIFYDFETRQDERMTCEKGYSPSKPRCKKCVRKVTQCDSCKVCKNCGENTCGLQQHEVNFAVLQTSCDFCKDEELTSDSKCTNCG